MNEYLDHLISAANIQEIYLIKYLREGEWYLKKIFVGEGPYQVFWTPHRVNAEVFLDERAVEEYKHLYLRSREVVIERVERTKKNVWGF